MEREEIIQGTLDWCNTQRALRGREPITELPRGKRGDGGSCPCGAATGLHVGSLRYTNRQNAGTPTQDWPFLPPVVKRFVHGFDRGEFPEYDANPFTP